MMFASTLGVMLAMGIILTVLISMTIGYIATVGSTPDYTPKSNTVFKIKLDGTLADNPAENPFSALMGDKENMLSLKDLLETIRIAKQNDKIAGIYIESGLLSSGSASLEAIRRSLIDFKESGKFVVAYADNFTQGNYFLCSVADIAEGSAESRGISVNDINHYANEGLFFADPVKTVECGFIDELKYKPEVEAYVKELAGQNGEKLRSANLAQMKTLKASPTKNVPEIAVLYAEGEIKAQTPGNFYDIEQSITEKMADELIKLKNNDDVKAVVFRVNSPGGSAYISEQIWRQVVELKKVKPVVVSMGNVAASGGYYISCAANKIIAEPNTLTGSIGIFGMFPNASGLFGKLALTTDIVKTNTFSDLGDLSRPMTESEKALIQGYVERGYQTFLSRCAEGRGMTTEAVNAIGQGRVWTGEQAKERGLVDELGGIELAISTAAGLADLDQYSVTTVSGSKNFLDEFLESQLGEVKLSIVKNVLGNEFEYFKTLNNIKTNCGIQARMPYDMKPL